MPKRKQIVIELAPSGCYVCTSHACNDEGRTCVKFQGKVRKLYHVVYEQRNGQIPRGAVVRHSCDNPRCVNPNHLILGDHAANVRDRVERGRSAKGTSHGRSKLDEKKIRHIRTSRMTNRELADRYEVDAKLIRDIRNNKIWIGV